MKGVLGNGLAKKVGFKALPHDTAVGACSAEEKKVEDVDEQKFPALSLSSSSASKQAATPSTCSPASSSSSTCPSRSTPSNNNSKNPKGFRKKFRLPKYFRTRRHSTESSNSNSSQGEHSEDEELEKAAESESDDPVMAVFQSRYKNRVRWALDDQPVAEEYSPRKKATEDVPADNGKDGKEEVNGSILAEEGIDSSPSPATSGKAATSSSGSIKRFVTGALFGGGSRSAASDKEFQQEVAKEVEAQKDLVWESNSDSPDGGEVLYTRQRKNAGSNSDQSEQLTISFTEKPKTRATVLKLMKKGRRAQTVYYRYDYAVKYFVRAMDMLNAEKYPDSHPTVRKVMEELNDAHHQQSSFNNSANVSQCTGLTALHMYHVVVATQPGMSSDCQDRNKV